MVAAFATLTEQRLLVDGEILVVVGRRFDFSALLARTHPAASRVGRLAAETPARFVAFDLLAAGDADLRDRPFDERRALLEQVMADARPPLWVTPTTTSREEAGRWLGLAGGGIDGVVAKPGGLRYQPGKRAMVKVNLDRTADCVVAGMRVFPDGTVGSLLLALYDGTTLRHVGVASSFPQRRRLELVLELAPYVVQLEGHPWEHGFGLEGGPLGRLKGAAGRWTPDMERDWVPLRPERGCEVGYDAVERWRFRHPAHWRPRPRPPLVHLRPAHRRHPRRCRRRPAGVLMKPQPVSDDHEIEVGGRRLRVTNLDKVLWPETGFTKGDVLDYYQQAAPVLLPAR